MSTLLQQSQYSRAAAVAPVVQSSSAVASRVPVRSQELRATQPGLSVASALTRQSLCSPSRQPATPLQSRRTSPLLSRETPMSRGNSPSARSFSPTGKLGATEASSSRAAAEFHRENSFTCSSPSRGARESSCQVGPQRHIPRLAGPQLRAMTTVSAEDQRKLASPSKAPVVAAPQQRETSVKLQHPSPLRSRSASPENSFAVTPSKLIKASASHQAAVEHPREGTCNYPRVLQARHPRESPTVSTDTPRVASPKPGEASPKFIRPVPLRARSASPESSMVTGVSVLRQSLQRSMEKLGAMDMQNSRQSLQRSRIASPVQACKQSPKPTITPARAIESKLRSRREEKQEDVSPSGLTESRVIADVDTFEVSTPPETPAKAPLVLGNVRVVPPVRAQQLSSPSLKSTCLQTLSSTTTSTTHSLGTVGASDVGSLAHEHVSLGSARCEPGEQEQAALALKLAVFDFDCTLSVLHIFGSLSGSVPTSSPVPAPHARTEIGQLVRLQALDMDPLWGPGVFALKAFGGVRRVEQLRSFLGELRRHGVECVVCSCGMVGTMRKCLDQVGLLQFFSKTYGHVSDSLGATEYDLRVSAAAVGRNACFLGTAAMAMPATKNEVIANFISDLNLDSEQVLLIDDSISDVWKAQGLCRTLFVRHGRGMGESEFQTVKDMLTSKASS